MFPNSPYPGGGFTQLLGVRCLPMTVKQMLIMWLTADITRHMCAFVGCGNSGSSDASLLARGENGGLGARC